MRRARRTIQFYEGNLSRFVLTLPGGQDLPIADALTPSNIRQFLAGLDSSYSRDTLSAYDRTLRTFSKFALAERWIDVDPMAGRPRLRQARNTLPDSLESEEIRALLAACGTGDIGLRDRAFMLLLLDTGMRAGEICALTANRVHRDSQRGRIDILAAESKGESDRVVMFCGETMEALNAWLAIYDPGWDGPVFVAFDGRRRSTLRALTPGGLNQMMRRRAAQAGVEGKGRWCHIWRHTFAKFYIKSGGDLESLRRLLGHSSLETTRIYLQFCVDELEDLHSKRSPVHRMFMDRA